MLRCLGFDHGTLRAALRLVFTVRRCLVDYRAPARLDDLLEVRTRLVAPRRRLARSGAADPARGRLLARLELRLALLGAELRRRPPAAPSCAPRSIGSQGARPDPARPADVRLTA